MLHENKFQYSKDYVTWREDRWLKFFGSLKEKQNLKYLEIGSFEGRSVIWMMENIFSHPTSSGQIIDSFYDRNKEILNSNLGQAQLTEKVLIHEGSSHEILRTLPLESFDLIYIDGCHCPRHLLSDLALAWDLVKPKGFMMMDDYGYKGRPKNELSPEAICDFFTECFKNELSVIFKDYDLILQKTGKLHGNRD